MLGVMDFHRLRVDVRLERVVGIAKLGQGVSHVEILLRMTVIARSAAIPAAAGTGRGNLGLAPVGQTRLKMRVALVPPKPKLLDMTALSFMSRFSRRMGMPSAFSSSFWMLALAQTKPFCSIRME